MKPTTPPLFGMRRRVTVFALTCTAMVSMFTNAPRANAEIMFDIIALSGGVAPGGGTFSTNFGSLRTSNAGVAFEVNVLGAGGTSNESVIFSAGSGSTPQLVAQQGQAVPGPGGGTLGSISQVGLNNSGQVAFSSSGFGGSTSATDSASFITDSTRTNVTQLVRAGDTAPPGATGTADGSVNLSLSGDVFINDAGQVLDDNSFTGGTAVTLGQTSGVQVVTTEGSTIVDTANPTPTALEFGRSFGDFDLNDNGSVVLENSTNGGGVAGANLPGDEDTTLALIPGSGATPVVIAREGTDLPGRDGEFGFDFSNVRLNDLDQVTFLSSFLDGTSGGSADNEGFFFFDGSNVTEFVTEGDALPGGGFIDDINTSEISALTNSGLLAFETDVRTTATSGRTSTDAFLLADLSGTSPTLTEILRTGDAAGTNGFFTSIASGDTQINESGQVVFVADVTGTANGSADDSGIFLFDPTAGVSEIIREGDPFAGGTLGNFFSSTFSNRFSFADDGTLGFEFNLTDGRTGVALATIPAASTAAVPEPSTWALLTLGTIGFGGYQWRRRRKDTAQTV